MAHHRPKLATEIMREFATGKLVAAALDVSRQNPPEIWGKVAGLDNLLNSIIELASLSGWSEIPLQRPSADTSEPNNSVYGAETLMQQRTCRKQTSSKRIES